MSKQTNAFQKAIFFIHEQLKDTKAKVTESVELCENNITPPIKREIDVLIEKTENKKTFRIAIECRDRSSKDDITWIDSLIGKYKNLPVNRVIAVSRSGFSKSAELKAKAEKIELRTTNEVIATNWKEEFIKLGFCEFIVDFKLIKLIVEIKDKRLILVHPNYEIRSGNEKATFSEFIEYLKLNGWSEKLNKRFKENIPNLYKVKADLHKTAMVEHRIPVSNFQIKYENKIHDIKAVIVCLFTIPKVVEKNVNHYRYEGSMIARTKFNLDNLKKQFTIYATQAKPNELMNLSIDEKKTK